MEIFQYFRVRLSIMDIFLYPLINYQNADDPRERIVKLSDLFFLATVYMLNEMNSYSKILSIWRRNQK